MKKEIDFTLQDLITNFIITVSVILWLVFNYRFIASLDTTATQNRKAIVEQTKAIQTLSVYTKTIAKEVLITRQLVVDLRAAQIK